MSDEELQATEPKVPVFARLISVMQIVGASAAAVVMIIVLIEAPFQLLSILVLIPMFAMFGFAFLCGIRLWHGEARGYRGSMLVQALQIPVIHTSLLTYKFIFGFGATIFFSGGTGTVNFEFGGMSSLIILGEVPDPRIGVNVWAPIALAYLFTKQPRAGEPDGDSD